MTDPEEGRGFLSYFSHKLKMCVWSLPSGKLCKPDSWGGEQIATVCHGSLGRKDLSSTVTQGRLYSSFPPSPTTHHFASSYPKLPPSHVVPASVNVRSRYPSQKHSPSTLLKHLISHKTSTYKSYLLRAVSPKNLHDDTFRLGLFRRSKHFCVSFQQILCMFGLTKHTFSEFMKEEISSGHHNFSNTFSSV